MLQAGARTFVAEAGSVTGLSETAVMFAFVPAIVCISIFSDIFYLTNSSTTVRRFPTVHLILTRTNVQKTIFPNRFVGRLCLD